MSPCSPRLRCVRRSQSHGRSRSRWRSTLFAVSHPLCPSLALVTDAATLLPYMAQPSVSGFTSLFFLCHWLHKVFKILCWSTAVCLAQPCVGYCIKKPTCPRFDPAQESIVPIINRPDLKMHLRHKSVPGLLLNQALINEIATHCTFCHSGLQLARLESTSRNAIRTWFHQQSTFGSMFMFFFARVEAL